MSFLDLATRNLVTSREVIVHAHGDINAQLLETIEKGPVRDKIHAIRALEEMGCLMSLFIDWLGNALVITAYTPEALRARRTKDREMCSSIRGAPKEAQPKEPEVKLSYPAAIERMSIVLKSISPELALPS